LKVQILPLRPRRELSLLAGLILKNRYSGGTGWMTEASMHMSDKPLPCRLFIFLAFLLATSLVTMNVYGVEPSDYETVKKSELFKQRIFGVGEGYSSSDEISGNRASTIDT
jgi:hypothetical protein